jgi:hypothetical protein
MTSGGRTGNQVEVYLYDVTPGGAGFVRSATIDTQASRRLFAEALKRLEGCTAPTLATSAFAATRTSGITSTSTADLLQPSYVTLCMVRLQRSGPDEERRLLRALKVDLVESGHEVEELDGGLRLPEIDGRVVVLGML